MFRSYIYDFTLFSNQSTLRVRRTCTAFACATGLGIEKWCVKRKNNKYPKHQRKESLWTCRGWTEIIIALFMQTTKSEWTMSYELTARTIEIPIRVEINALLDESKLFLLKINPKGMDKIIRNKYIWSSLFIYKLFNIIWKKIFE